MIALVSTTHSQLSAPFGCFWWGKKHVPSHNAFSYSKQKLVVGFSPIEKYYSQNGIISPNSGENKKCLKPPPRQKPSPMNLIQDNSCLSWEFVIVKDGFVQTLETGVLEKGCAALGRVPGNMESIVNLNSFKQKHNKSPAWLQHQDNFNKKHGHNFRKPCE